MKSFLLLTSVCVCFGLTGCTHYAYVPNMHNVPLFRERNEVRLSGARGTCSDMAGTSVTTTEVQTAYSPTDHLGVTGNFIYGKSGEDESGSGSGHMIELGAGYFHPITDRFVVEVYAGYG